MELLIFRHPNRKIHYEFKIKLVGKKLYTSTFVKYLEVLIDSHQALCYVEFILVFFFPAYICLKIWGQIKNRHYLIIRLQTCLFNIPPVLKIHLTQLHGYVRCGTVLHKVKPPVVKTTVFGLCSIKFQSCQNSNFFIQHFRNVPFLTKADWDVYISYVLIISCLIYNLHIHFSVYKFSQICPFL